MTGLLSSRQTFTIIVVCCTSLTQYDAQCTCIVLNFALSLIDSIMIIIQRVSLICTTKHCEVFQEGIPVTGMRSVAIAIKTSALTRERPASNRGAHCCAIFLSATSQPSWKIPVMKLSHTIQSLTHAGGVF